MAEDNKGPVTQEGVKDFLTKYKDETFVLSLEVKNKPGLSVAIELGVDQLNDLKKTLSIDLASQLPTILINELVKMDQLKSHG